MFTHIFGAFVGHLTKIISFVVNIINIASSVFCATIAATFLMVLLSNPTINLLSGTSLVNRAENKPIIHELFPNSSWNDLEPCGLHFNEQEEYQKALQCVNSKVWPNSKISLNDPENHIPRCFIVKAQSPDIFTSPKAGFNFLPIFEITPVGLMTGAVVGVYQPETRTVFVVENIDAAMVYRHELQHYFLHIHDPETEGGGHDQNIWQQCEPPYYTPSDEVKAKQQNSDQ